MSEPTPPEEETRIIASDDADAEGSNSSSKGLFRRRKRSGGPQKKDLKWGLKLMGKVFLSLFALLFVVLVAVFVLMANLHSDWVKEPVLENVASTTGIDLDYETLSIQPFSGVEFRGLKIRNPGSFAEVAPDMLKLGVLHIQWDMSSLLSGGFRISSFEIGDLEVALVSDEHGNSSVTRLMEGLPEGEEKEEEEEEEKPPIQLSHILSFRDMPLFELTHFSFHGFRFEQFEMVEGKVAKHMELEDLGIWAEVEAGNGNLHVDFNLGSPEQSEGTRLTLEEHPGTDKSVVRKAVVFLRNAVSTPGENGISLAVEVDVRHQDFLNEFPSSATLLGTSMALTFHPEESRTRFHLEGLDLVQGASKTTLDVDLLDRKDGLVDPHIKKLAGQASADILMEVLALPLPGIDFNGAVADYALTDFRLDLESGAVTDGDLSFSVNLAKATVDLEGKNAALNSGVFKTDVKFVGSMKLHLDTVLEVDKVHFSDPVAGLEADLHDFAFSLKGQELTVNQEKPDASTGGVELGVKFGNARALVNQDEVNVAGFDLSINTVLDGSPVYQAQVALPVQKIEVLRAEAPLATVEGLSVNVDVNGVTQTLTETISAGLKVKLDAVHFEEGGMVADVKGLGVHVDALVRSLTSADVDIRLPLESLNFTDGKGVKAALSNLNFTVDLDGKEFFSGAPLASTADVKVGLGLGGLDASVPGSTVNLEGMNLSLETGVKPESPLGVSLRLPMDRLKVAQGGKTLLNSENAHIHLDVTDARVNLEDPQASDANVSWDIDLSPLSTKAAIAKAGNNLDLSLDFAMAHFKPVAAVLPSSVRKEVQIPWHKLKLNLNTKVALQGLDDPANAFVNQKTVVDLKGLSVKTPAVELATPKFTLDMATKGRGAVQKAKVNLSLSDLALNGRDYGESLSLSLDADANPFGPRVDSRVELKAPLDLYVLLENAVQFKGGSKKLSYRNRVVVQNLDFIKANLPPEAIEGLELDWKNIEINLDNEGGFSGLLASMRNFQPVPVKDPLARLTGEHRTEASIRGIDLVANKSVLQMPGLDFALQLTADQGELEGFAKVELPRLFAHPDGSRKPIEVDGLSFNTTLKSEGGVKDGKVFVTTVMDLKRLIHNKVEGYDIEGLALKMDVMMEQLNRLTINEFFFRNLAGGTDLTMTGVVDGLDPGRIQLDEFGIPGRQNVLLEGKLVQDLEPVKVNADTMSTSGKIALPFKLSSGDMKVFRFVGEMSADGLTVEMPDDGIALVGFNGRIPLVQDIAVGDDGVVILPGPSKNLYSRKQFSDVQPFLKTDNFISIERIDFMGQTMAPIAGNLRVERDLFAMDQLQIGFRGGNIFGQVVVDYEGGSPKVFFKGNVTGIRPSESKDVLDANATLSLEPMTLKLDGRIQVVRIGRQHLLDMIDVIDPYREDVNMNRARMGLEIGYPKFMRMRMQHGFLAVKLELGGAGSAIRLDEIRGIALGPFLNTYVAPALAGGE